MRSTIAGFCFIALGCGTDGPGPSIPSAVRGSEVPSSDAIATVPPPVSPSAPEAIPEPNPVSPSTLPLPPVPVEPPGEVSDPRFSPLPLALRTTILDCEAKGRLYDFSTQLCSKTRLASFICKVDENFKSLIFPASIKPLEDYISLEVPDLILYACTEDIGDIRLHFYKFEKDVITYRKVSVAKK